MKGSCHTVDKAKKLIHIQLEEAQFKHYTPSNSLDKDTEFDTLIRKLSENLELSFKKEANVYTVLVDDIKSSISILDLCPVEISSTELRAHQGFGLTKSLENYIKDNKLYLGE